MKYIPNKIVISNLFFLSENFIFKIEWWDQVIVKPEETKTIVFNKGISRGLKGCTPMGGHNWPISILGDKAEWK